METNGIRVLERALDILNFMAESGEPARVSDIAGATGLSPATTYRILSTLRERNVVLQGENSLYMIGPTSLFWSGAYRPRLALSRAFRIHAAELWEMSRETIHLFSFERDRIYYVDKMDSPQVVAMRSRIGAWRDLYSTGGGRAVLGALPEAERESYLDNTPLVPHTAHTRTDRRVLLELLEEGTRRGYQEEVNENESGIRCVGAPVLNSTGYPLGAVSVAAPSYRLDDDGAEKIGRMARVTADKITASLMRK
ncbi:MAG: IclR family transcriptional regulator [Synergistaceae bacterium]|jgi:DNA-binding IclR family transcriptional regulator|nr:IclR family transcriptional regulator [Synergistaceae bacterium]